MKIKFYLSLFIFNSSLFILFSPALLISQDDRGKTTSKDEKTTTAGEKNPEQARLAVLHFLNETKSKNYEYLKESISEAIVSSMRKNFYFEMPNAQRNQELANILLKSSKSFNAKELKGLCSTADVDYAMYGNFVLLKNGDIKMESGIYSVADERIIARNSKTIETNSSMFDNTNVAALGFVLTIREYIQDQKKAKDEKRRLQLKPEEPKVEKVVQADPEKNETNDKNKDSGNPPLKINSADDSSVFIQAFGYGILGSFNYARRFKNVFSIGIGAGFFPADKNSVITGALDFGYRFYDNFILKAGPYLISSKHMQFGAHGGVGYQWNVFRQFFIEPAAVVLWTAKAFYPYGALSMGVKF